MARAPVRLDAVTRVLRATDLLREVRGPEDIAVSGVSQDSRDITEGDLFLAWEGSTFDAHDVVEDAANAGAVAAVVERPVEAAPVPQLVVRNGRRAAAFAADVVMDSPWKLLFTAAVTGTNGKTTTATLARHLLDGRGPSASVGTLGVVGSGGSVVPGTEGLTTPGPVAVAETVRRLADDGVESVVFEASSHALDQHRLDALRFDVVAFTNLSREHLDYHGSLEAYAVAKARLQELKKPGGWTVINTDEQAWSILEPPDRQTLTYGSAVEAELRSEQVVAHERGTRFTLVIEDLRIPIELPLLGDYNVENALAAAGIGRAAGMDAETIGERLNGAPQIPGRLEVVVAEPFRVLIDFAHTPDALERVLRTLRPLVSGRLIVVFGAGGDRDPSKRPAMGRVVEHLADLPIVTSDNPRTEDPETIIAEIEEGMEGSRHACIPDREEAIAHAVESALAGDLVLLAGKGHESYQIVGAEKRPFDEAAIARTAMTVHGGAD